MSTDVAQTHAGLQARIRGDLVRPTDPDYNPVREIWNRRFDRRPAVIVRCADQSDVAEAIQYGREHRLEIAVRGGGHHVAGHASCEEGLLIDLSRLRGVQVDPIARVATVQGGCVWGDVDRETQRFGLACPGPIISMTGVAGCALGGGFGWLQRKHGLSCDNIESADLVTASGAPVRASLDDDAELLWGLRGAGWNFGVVTSFQLALHAVGPRVLAGVLYFPIESFPDLVEFHRTVLDEAPEELTTWLLLRLAPSVASIPSSVHGKPVCALGFCYSGNREEAERWADRVRRSTTLLADLIEWRDFVGWQSALDQRWGNGFFNDWRSHYFDELTPQCVGALVEHVAPLDSPWTDIKIPHLGGAVRRSPQGGAAFGSRDARYCVVIQARWSEAHESEKHIAWATSLQRALAPFSRSGAYPNFLAADESSRIAESYSGAALTRLRCLKQRMDPENVFRLNPNIPPYDNSQRI